MNLSVTFSEPLKTDMRVGFREIGSDMDVDFGAIQIVNIGAQNYEGDYVVTPKVNSQTIPTKGRIMSEDVTVKAIPYFDVSNTSGGSTVYIAKEI